MKKLLLVLALISMIVFPIFAVSGTYTDNEYFYLPGYGAYGTDEWEKYNDYMQIADDQIEANKTSGGNENIQDVAGGMFSGNTETFITVTYQDGDGTIDLVLPILDEDNMSTNSDTHLATQQSIKAYSDALHALQYLKTEMDALSELEAIWSKDVTDSTELAAALGDYYLKTAIDTIGEVESIWSKDITDSSELTSALADYYLKTAIDELSEVEAIYSKDIIDSGELDAFTGTTNIVTLGTITEGTWTATAITDSYIAWGTGAGQVSGVDLPIIDSAFTVDDGFDAGLRNGVYSGLAVTDSAELNIYWTEGVAYVDGSIFAVDADASEDIANNATTYLYVLKDNATMQESTTEPVTGVVGEFALVCILSTYANDIHEKFDFPLMSGTLRYDMWKFLDAITPTACVGGCDTTIDTDATLANDFKITTGTYYTDVLELNTISSILYSSTATHDGTNVTAYYHSASAWTTGAEAGISFTQWDNGTQKTNTAANKWYTGWIYIEDGDTLIYVYPQTEHASEGDALDEAAQFPPYHEGIILPSAKFIFRHGESAFGARAYIIDIRPFFGYGDGATAQMIYQTVTGDSGTTTATASDDSIAIVGDGIATTAITADTITVTATEVDSVVGAVTGIVEADGAGNISAATAGTDYAIPGANDDITSMTGLSNDGIPLAKVANAASDGANSDITSMTGLTTPLAGVYGGTGKATITDESFLKGGAGNTYEERTIAEVKTDLAYQLSDLSDVNTSTATDKFVLVADGVDFESRQLTSDDLSDVASIAMLDEAETVTGGWTFNDYLYISGIHDASEPYIIFNRKRDGDPSDNVADTDILGVFEFYGYHTDGYDFGAMIRATVDGTPGNADMPTKLEFFTTPDDDNSPVLRQAIDNAGNIKMGDGVWTNFINVSAGGVLTLEGTANIEGVDATELGYVDGVTEDIQTALDTILANVVEDTSPELGGEMDAGAHSIGFTLQTDTGTGAKTIDWKLGNKMKFTFGAGNVTFTFTSPTNPCTLMLTLIQDVTGSRTVTWPATVKWPGGTEATLSTAANARDKVALDWDGSQYDAVISKDFK